MHDNGRFIEETGAPTVPVHDEEVATMAKGTVKWFNVDKGYGFIQPEDGGNDIFIHITAVQEAGLRSLEENQNIEFELVEGRNGRMSAGQLKIS